MALNAAQIAELGGRMLSHGLDIGTPAQIKAIVYALMFAAKDYIPNGNFDILYPADLDAGLPEGAALNTYDGYIWKGSKQSHRTTLCAKNLTLMMMF